MGSVWVILINYKNPELTIECVSSLRRAKCKDLHIIIIDNNSPDNSYEILVEKISGEIILKADTNNGFSSGNNIGIRYALEKNADYIMLLNNDTVIDEMMIEHLLNNANDFTVTVPKMYYYSHPELIWYAGGSVNKRLGKTVHLGQNMIDDGSCEKKKYVEFATGCCIMIPQKIIKKVGLLDELYFMYWEDVDYSFRLKENDIKILYIPDAKLWHKVSASAGDKSVLSIYYGNRNRMYIMKKYKFPITAWIYFFSTRIIYLIKSFFINSSDKYIAKAIKDFIKGIKGKVDL